MIAKRLASLNVTLDVTLGDNSDYQQAVAQAMKSGSTPDVILKVWPAEIEAYANDGLLLPISDYMAQMPHFSAYITEHQLVDYSRDHEVHVFVHTSRKRGTMIIQVAQHALSVYYTLDLPHPVNH